MKMKFTKMHGIGNDYVYMDCTKERLENPGEIARLVSDRHKGIGSDGLILIQSPTRQILKWPCTTRTVPTEKCVATASAAWRNTSTTTV